jgi:hypothetical protein
MADGRDLKFGRMRAEILRFGAIAPADHRTAAQL